MKFVRDRGTRLLAGMVALVAIWLFSTEVAMAQWGRWGRPGVGFGGFAGGHPVGGFEGSFGGPYGSPGAGFGHPGYGFQGGQPVAPGYPPGGYGAPGYQPPAYPNRYAYPPTGQSQQQAATKEMQCQTWATAQSGYNPNAPTAGGAGGSSESQMGGGVGLFRSAGRGAAIGAVGGAIGGDAGKGAAIGAATSALIGGFRRWDERRSQMERQSQDLQMQSQKMAAYTRALEACLTGQGYVVR